MTALERCPFCGEEAELDNDFLDTYSVACLNVDCGAMTGRARTEEGAARAWNRRTPDYRALAQELAEALVVISEWRFDIMGDCVADARKIAHDALAAAKEAGLL